MRRRIVWTAVAGSWLIAIGSSLDFAHRTRIGGVLVSFGPRHGVHVGDVVAVALATVAATLATWVLLSTL
jgi:hypothetical protein